MELTNDEIKRYGRHLLLPEIGKGGQLKLKRARILLVGAGGLGSPQAIYLSAAGVGTLGLVDFDRVEFSNLQRQVIHFTPDIGKSKVISAQEKIVQINPEVKVIPHETILNAQNALDIIQGYDLIIDGTDNFPTRYLINDACIFLGKPFIYGGIFRFEGQCSVFGFDRGPCYRCFFQQPPAPGSVPSCAEAGVLGVLPGIIGLLQANEAIKVICQIGKPLKGRLLLFDALATHFREIQIKKDPTCPMCSPNRTIHALVEYAPICHDQTHTPPGTSANESSPEVTVQELKQIIDDQPSDFCLLDVREPEEWEIAHIKGAILKPLSELENNFQDIPTDKRVFVHCKMGGRSQKAIQFLANKGYRHLVHVKGGIDAWAREIDTTMPQY